jgi:hypothetical protein
MWKATGKCSPKCTLYRKFEIIGCIRSNGTFQMPSAFFPNSNFGFNLRHMLVTTIWVRKVEFFVCVEHNWETDRGVIGIKENRERGESKLLEKTKGVGKEMEKGNKKGKKTGK